VFVSALKAHDEAAYRQLYLHYRGAVYNIILQLIPDKETANDVLQEVFTTVWQQIHRYDSNKGRLFTWLAKLTRNTAINKLRSKNYQSGLKTESIENVVSSVEGIHSQQHNINHIGLRQQVEQLREDYKNVIVLSYYNGYTQEEIAKVLGIPLGTVKTRLRSGLIELRKQFN
jgi:RNA polymerase sigma factor (sigma-70 family)